MRPMRPPRVRHLVGSTFAVVAALACLAALAACGSSNSPGPPKGSASLVFTDAPLDQIDVFEVDVVGVSLRKQRGETVDVLAGRVRVDFARLSDAGDLAAALELDPGTYDRLVVRLDFSTATVVLLDRPDRATVTDGSGRVLDGVVEVATGFGVRSLPSVRRDRNHVLRLDLDLDQGLEVDAAGNRVTFLPVLSARFDPAEPTRFFASGTLASLDRGTRSLALDKRSPDGTAVSRLAVEITTTTCVHVGRDASVGDGGVGLLATLPTGATRAVARGTLEPAEPNVVASAVESGGATPGNGSDWVEGHVVARRGGRGLDAVVTVLGRSEAGDGRRRFNTLHTVRVQFGITRVRRLGRIVGFETDALAVGQRVIAFGFLRGTELDATGFGSTVRLLPTTVVGVADGVAQRGVIALDVQRFDDRDVDRFDFEVGGFDEADPRAYTVDVRGLDARAAAEIRGVSAGSRLRVTGWVGPIGVLTDAAFTAASAVDTATDDELLVAAWEPPGAAAVVDADDDRLVLDLRGTRTRIVDDGFDRTELDAAVRLAIAPRAPTGLYRIVDAADGAVTVNLDFRRFSIDLRNRLIFSPGVVRVTASGKRDADGTAFAADVVTAVLR